MAFGKKKDDAVGAPELDGAMEPLFPADEGSDEQEEDDVAAPPGATATAEPPAIASATPAADASDSLLSMFQGSDEGDADRSIVLELAGDVDLADLLEEMHTLAAAMGINVAV